MPQDISLAAAFAAGIVSFFAPCILPLIPPYLAWLSSTSLEKNSGKSQLKQKLFLRSLLLIFGFSVVFVILGAGASFLGQIFSPHRLFFQKAGGLLIIFFGLEFSGIFNLFKNYRLDFLKNLFLKLGPKTSSFLVGLTFALAWVACFSPILGSILILSSFQKTLNQGIVLLIFYSLGLALPFLLTSLLLGIGIDRIKDLAKIAKWINLFSGLILALMGALLFTDNFYKIVAWLAIILPDLKY